MGEVASAVGRAPVPLVETGPGPSSALGPGVALARAFWAHASWVGARRRSFSRSTTSRSRRRVGTDREGGDVPVESDRGQVAVRRVLRSLATESTAASLRPRLASRALVVRLSGGALSCAST